MWITMGRESVLWIIEPTWDDDAGIWIGRGDRGALTVYMAKDICPKIAPGQKYELPGKAKLTESHLT